MFHFVGALSTTVGIYRGPSESDTEPRRERSTTDRGTDDQSTGQVRSV